MSVVHRNAARVIGAGAASGLLTAGLSFPAMAATAPFPHVSVAAAKAALPSAKASLAASSSSAQPG